MRKAPDGRSVRGLRVETPAAHVGGVCRSGQEGVPGLAKPSAQAVGVRLAGRRPRDHMCVRPPRLGLPPCRAEGGGGPSARSVRCCMVSGQAAFLFSQSRRASLSAPTVKVSQSSFLMTLFSIGCRSSLVRV